MINKDKRRDELLANMSEKTEKQRYILNKIQFWLILILTAAMSTFLISYIINEDVELNYEGQTFINAIKYIPLVIVAFLGLCSSINSYKKRKTEQEDGE